MVDLQAPETDRSDSVEPNGHAIEARGLSHAFMRRGREAKRNGTARIQALRDVQFTVGSGEIVGVLGPNGSGKSTLFRIIATLLTADHGQVRLFGVDVGLQPARARNLFGIVFQSPAVDRMLSARENLHHQAALYGLKPRDLTGVMAGLLERFDLTGRADDPVGMLSGGFQRRVELAKAMLHRPRILLMDEPSASIDPAARLEMWRHLQALRQSDGLTVFLTTHLLEEAERCDRLLMMHEGRLVADGTPTQLKADSGVAVLNLTPRHEPGDDPDRLSARLIEAIAAQTTPDGGRWPAEKRDGQVIIRHPHVNRLAAELLNHHASWIEQLHLGHPTLEDAFVALTGRRLEE
ncbi:MAG: ABC transporter ATP-binding protein [Phycisphaeraceae bacterium]|nr:ABC transporter ATP-binding protein [Phycisphaeraceae bacterium]